MPNENDREGRGATTRVTNCSSPGGGATSIELRVVDGLLEFRVQPGSIGLLTPEDAAGLRRQIADTIADALQGARWKS
jgi:hypothetical protein